jgi:hypothetical protein
MKPSSAVESTAWFFISLGRGKRTDMNNPTSSRALSQVTLVILAVVGVCVYALFFQAYEINNWRGFWFSLAHVAIVALGAWLALRKAC